MEDMVLDLFDEPVLSWSLPAGTKENHITLSQNTWYLLSNGSRYVSTNCQPDKILLLKFTRFQSFWQ